MDTKRVFSKYRHKMNNLTYICVEIAQVTYKISNIEVDVKEKKK